MPPQNFFTFKCKDGQSEDQKKQEKSEILSRNKEWVLKLSGLIQSLFQKVAMGNSTISEKYLGEIKRIQEQGTDLISDIVKLQRDLRSFCEVPRLADEVK